MSTATMGAIGLGPVPTAPPTNHPVALAVADAGWATTEHLFRELDRDEIDVLLLKCLDYVNGWRRGLYPWSRACRMRRSGPRRWERQHVLPSGWMKRYPRLGMRPIARSVGSWWAGRPGSRRGLVMTYPHYLYLRDRLRPDFSVYYNFDDYTLYWPGHADLLRELEREAVRSSAVTVCVAWSRAEELRQAVPEAAGRIHHIPHGTPSRFLAPDPLDRPADPPTDLADLPRPLLGYVGSMEDRVDWELMDRLSLAMPSASIVVVGRVGSPGGQPWWEPCARFLARPNVHAIGWRSQEELARYYQSFDATLIPYRLDHPFNRACSPTKIMDAMGSGRPIVATAIPECRLHLDRFHVAEDADGFVSAVREIVDGGSDDGRSALRHAFAAEQSCRAVAGRILDLATAGD